MKTKLISSTILLAACFAFLLPSVHADGLADARARYADGEYEQAAKMFEQVLESGAPQAAVYFELGRSFRQSGQDARAALSFRRALVLDPRFTPARAALEETNADLAIPRVPLTWKQKVLDRVPMDALALGGTLLFWIAAFLLMILALRRAPAGRPSVVLGVLVLLLATASLALAWICDPRISGRNDAIVLTTGGTTLLNAPADQSEKVAALPEGGLVKILSQRGRWFYGQTGAGQRGWFLTEGIVPVIPPA